MTPTQIQQTLATILPRVSKPGRYTGGELNQVVKPWSTTPMRVALGFPDIYDLGMPNLGLAILYDLINKQPDMLAERFYLPWSDMQEQMRAVQLPLYALESKHALRDFDVIGFSLPYETVYTNLLSALDLAGIAVLSAERIESDPIIIAGGHATFNPEPAADFIDAFVIGEGEEVALDIAHAVKRGRDAKKLRVDILRSLAQIEGVYVPRFYRAVYDEAGVLKRTESIDAAAPAIVRKRIVAQLPPPVTNFIVPFLELVHNRVAVEIMRGCTRGCRFCQAGMITRPVRERPVAEVVEAIERALDATGFEEVGLMSLSSSDYTYVAELVRTVAERFKGRQLNVGLPSLRIESFSVELMDLLMGQSRRSGFTLAPEAASERMREIINKPVSTEGVITTAREIYKRGWNTIKLYFMIGHPAETLEDVKAIADLARAVLKEGQQAMGNKARVHVGVSTFVPKPHTPFQWVPCDTKEQVEAKQALLRRDLNHRNIKVNWTDVPDTLLEAWLSRGDRKMGAVILEAWRRGARFDAWREHFRYDLWLEAFEAVGLNPADYTHRVRALDETLPWDHIDCAVNKTFLVEDYQWSMGKKTRVDCRDKCFACGILPKFKEIRRENPGEIWRCPDVGKAAIKAQLPKVRNDAPHQLS